MNKITTVTRRDVIDILKEEYSNCFQEPGESMEFLKRLYNLEVLPSGDNRYANAEGDIYQHTINNDDWRWDWVFIDKRFELKTSDVKLLEFICQIFHPVVRKESDDRKKRLDEINNLLKKDGLELYVEKTMSERSVWSWKNIDSIRKKEDSTYMSLTKIGEGSYARVFSYFDEYYDKKFALKKVKDDISVKDLFRFKQEYQIMKFSKIRDSEILLFFNKGIEDNLENRYQNIDKMIQGVVSLKNKLIKQKDHSTTS